MTFTDMIDNLELALEDATVNPDAFRSDNAAVILHQIGGLRDAIDRWREGTWHE